MKRLILTTVLLLLLPAATFARQQSLLARVTVYWASGGGGSDACTRQHKCSTGAILRTGHCAVDPKKIPYGSRVIFPDATCVAVDTGRDVINRKAARRAGRTASERSALVIDRFFETKGQAMAWANANPHFMTVRVEPPDDKSDQNMTLSAGRENSRTRFRNGMPGFASNSSAIPHSPNVGTTDNPPNAFLADNGDRGRLQLPRGL